MRPNRFLKLLGLFVFASALCQTCWADQLDTIVAQTQSTDPEVRVAGFEALQPYLAQSPIDPRALTAVVDLLVLETSSSDSVDSDAEYFSDLITAVVNLNDPSAVPSLVGVIGSGNMVPRRLAQYGTAALDQVIARATDSDWIVRKCVMITLTNMLSPANLPLVSDSQSLAKINATLSQGLLDSSPYVSESAAVGLQLLADKTPPVTIATASPGPNASGWNNTNTTVSLNSADNESGGTGVKQVTYSATGAQTIASTVVPGATASFTVSTEGVTTITFFGMDNAGNVEAPKTITVQVDKTPPEAYDQFDPVAHDVVVFGRDLLSGVAPGPVALKSVVPILGDKEDDGKDGEDEHHARRELRTYQVLDRAGNSVQVVEMVRKDRHHISVQVISLQYGQSAVLNLPRNEQTFEWHLREDGSLRELEQEFQVGPGREAQRVVARFDASKNQTIIVQQEPEPRTKVVKPGLDLLRMATSAGSLTIEF